jgi:hypothetical protein
MVCFRSRRLAAGFFVCSVVLGACGGKKDEGGGAGDKGGASGASNKDLDVIPVDSEIVLGVDLAQAQKSALFRELVLPRMTRSGDIQKVIETLKTKCNIDPLTAATGLTAGLKGMDTRNPDAVAVLHGIEKAKALACLDQVKEELAAEKVEVVKDGEVVSIKTGARGDLAFTFTGDTTAVLVLGPQANKERVLEVAQGKSTLKTSKEFNEMYGRVQAGQTAWVVARADVGPAKNLEKLNVKAKTIFGSANITDGLEINGRIRVESEEQAKNFADLAKSQAAMFSKMAEKLEIEPDKNDVRFTVVFTQPQLTSVVGLLKSFGRGFR